MGTFCLRENVDQRPHIDSWCLVAHLVNNITSYNLDGLVDPSDIGQYDRFDQLLGLLFEYHNFFQCFL